MQFRAINTIGRYIMFIIFHETDKQLVEFVIKCDKYLIFMMYFIQTYAKLSVSRLYNFHFLKKQGNVKAALKIIL